MKVSAGPLMLSILPVISDTWWMSGSAANEENQTVATSNKEHAAIR